MSLMPPYHTEQSAGLSTAESDSMSGSKNDRSPNSSFLVAKNDALKHNIDGATPVSVEVNTAMVPPNAVSPSPPNPPASPKSRGRRSILGRVRGGKRGSSSSRGSERLSLSASLTNSAPTILIHTPSTASSDADPSVAPLRRPIRSSMSSRTLHESLHRGKLARPKMDRSVSFASVNIREYERVLGDNPSVTSGPPLSIGWRYSRDPLVMAIEDYEEGKGLPRSSSEYLVPKAVRENLLREHAEVSRNEMVHAIRAIQREKAQRRKTVVNLSMQPTEEKIEGMKRKVKKILKPSLSYENMEAKMWDEAHAVAMEKARRLEESIRSGESVSSRDLYRVGTPCNNILPSRSNSIPRNMTVQDSQDEKISTLDNKVAASKKPAQEKPPESSDGTSETVEANGLSMESLTKGMQYKPKAVEQGQRRQSEGELDVSKKGGYHHHHNEGTHSRASSTIVAEEDEYDDIFAKLVLADASQ